MKIKDIVKLDDNRSKKIIKRIMKKLKNDIETDIPHGWRAGPHQGTFNKMRMTR